MRGLTTSQFMQLTWFSPRCAVSIVPRVAMYTCWMEDMHPTHADLVDVDLYIRKHAGPMDFHASQSLPKEAQGQLQATDPTPSGC